MGSVRGQLRWAFTGPDGVEPASAVFLEKKNVSLLTALDPVNGRHSIRLNGFLLVFFYCIQRKEGARSELDRVIEGGTKGFQARGRCFLGVGLSGFGVFPS